MLEGKRILLIIGGGIAAYRSLELIRRLRERQCGVSVILTAAASQFITALSASSLSGEKTHTELFDLTAETEIGHIQLSRSADLVVIAPATADLLAKLAAGIANDLASTVLLATDKPVLAAPAMNVRMWLHAATQRNCRRLAEDGVAFVGPEEGPMACGEFGMGRMPDPETIVAAIAAKLARSGPFSGKKVLVTAGPTREAIDPVRYLSNQSSGKQGYAVAAAAAALGAETVLVSGPVSLPAPTGVRRILVESARDMLQAVEAELPCDVAIFTAAVADWRVGSPAGQKIKRGRGRPELALVENPDILRTIATARDNRPAVVVGFAAETEEVIAHGMAKLKAKGCDLMIANDVSPETGVLGGEHNRVHVISAAGVESWRGMSKREVADQLMQLIVARLRAPARAAE
ncbi:MAG: bifunctional phosphopantothenoylcysteine decarboxylase/phosphopantothenate--cysteine ligase CoaBC [Pseudomonadota bacterium]|nr:bifunctional phosphopantothenoylcysteine decarboxylase/phosphopantothenate--cysteine ligase CoaBC [Pseudomonadota bacterium]